MKSYLPLVLALVAVAAWLAEGWGPASHFLFTCSTVRDDPSCINNKDNYDLLSGTEMPDAFFFGDMVTGSPCVGFGALHNPYFAGYQVQVALNNSRNGGTCYGTEPGKPSSKDCFNALDFALGFGAHVVADAAAFLYPTAYLGNGFRGKFSASGNGETNWISVWSFMTAVDAYVAQNKFSAGSKLPEVLMLDINATEFIVQANAEFRKVMPIAPNPTVDEVGNCAMQWHHVVKNECEKAQSLPQASYEWEMTFNDNFGAKNFSEAKAHYDLAASCAMDAIQVWQKIILNGTSPTDAVMQTVEVLSAWFAQGKCTPGPQFPPTAAPTSQGALDRLLGYWKIPNPANV